MTRPTLPPGLCVLPFAGFYNSWHDDALDRALSQAFSDSNGDENGPLEERAFGLIDWQAAHVGYAELYTQALAREFKLPGLVFESLTRPREYNFETDRIFAVMPAAEWVRILAATPRPALDTVAAEWFTSRSGFSSFYSPHVEDWGDPSTWDHNQRGALLAAYVRHEHGREFDSSAEFDLMESAVCNGHVDNLLTARPAQADELARLFRIADYLRTRQERTWRHSLA